MIRLIISLFLVGLPLFQTLKAGESEKRFLKAPRVKRDLLSGLYPGTKWCGRGNNAAHKYDLGSLRNVDACCRDHDSCPYYVPSFSHAHGIFNPTIIAWSSCECDSNFYSCLKSSGNDGIGVGISYFNVIKNTCIYQGHPLKCDYFWGIPTRCYSDNSRWTWYTRPTGMTY